MSDATREPFNREEFLNEPGIIGARWWQRSLASAPDPVTRRAALTGVLVAGGAMVAFGMMVSVIAASSSSSSSSSDEYRTEPRSSLDMQKQYGWSFGAVSESLTFDGTTQKAFERAALSRLSDDLRPSNRAHAPFYVPTLFESPAALPRSTPTGDSGTVTPLKDALRPIFTGGMDRAYRAGRALASLFRGQAPAAAVIVDLPGPEAVAFAAGAAGVLDPVFLFDNWPHPRGVVPAHLALAAAAYYQPLFAKKRAPSGAAPLFVLDRSRLAYYSDDATQFDNRHVARLPSAAQMKLIGATRVLHVVPKGSELPEKDDLNDDFVLYARAGMDVKIVGADAFSPDPTDTAPPSSADEDDPVPRSYYGGRIGAHAYFWIDYPWVKAPVTRPGSKPTEPSFSRPGKDYAPRARVTPFSSGAPSPGATRPRPATFASVPVVIAVATGAVLGAKLSRSGSWNRSSSWGTGS